MTASERPTVVLVHGAHHGAWCWDAVVEGLGAAGLRSVAIDLPLTSLADDVAATREAIDAVAGPVLLVGHSYGGAVVTDAGCHRSVTRLVYISAVVPEEQQSALLAASDLRASRDLPASHGGLAVGEDGTISVDPAHARHAFYDDCDPDVAAAAIARLRPTALACISEPVTCVAWRDRPATYALCTADASVPAELQQGFAARCSAAVVEWPTGHSPFLSRPDLVSALLSELADQRSGAAHAGERA